MVSIIVAAYTGKMDEITQALFNSAKGAVTLALSLIGAMALWLGILKVAEVAGLTTLIARAIRPVMIRLFPDVPAEHPAMSAMIMNMAANMLGLGNAATPFGIKAMTELDKLNPQKGTATNAMCLFLAINTSSVTILPLGVITIRAAAGASQPAAIIIPAILATCCSTTAAIFMAKLLTRRQLQQSTVPLDDSNNEPIKNSVNAQQNLRSSIGLGTKITLWCTVVIFLGAIPYNIFVRHVPIDFSYTILTKATTWFLPVFMGGLLFFGFIRGVHVYEAVTEGAKEGFQVAIRIIPFMVAIFVAIGMFRESGALELLGNLIKPLTSLIGFPTEVLPMALLRPLSGTGSFGVMSEIISNAPNGFSAFLASIMQGSTETTFYVMAVYFGAVGIRRTRHALSAALFADGVGICASLLLSHLFFSIM
jgi:spore maturation protein SpmA